MRLLRYLYILALVMWLGGIVVAGGVVAPSVFEVLQAADASNGRVLAGLVFGEVLARVHLLAYVMGSVMFVALTLHRVLGARPERYGIRAAIVGTMLAVTLYSGSVVLPSVAAVQAEVAGPIAQLADADPRKIEFNRLHGLANLLLGATAIGGLALLWWEARE